MKVQICKFAKIWVNYKSSSAKTLGALTLSVSKGTLKLEGNMIKSPPWPSTKLCLNVIYRERSGFYYKHWAGRNLVARINQLGWTHLNGDELLRGGLIACRPIRRSWVWIPLNAGIYSSTFLINFLSLKRWVRLIRYLMYVFSLWEYLKRCISSNDVPDKNGFLSSCAAGGKTGLLSRE